MLIVDIMHKQQNWHLYNIHDRFRYHQKMLSYWPDTDTDTRIGAALIIRFRPRLIFNENICLKSMFTNCFLFSNTSFEF